MPILAWVAALRVTGSPSTNFPIAEYAVFAVLAATLGLVVLIFIKASAQQTSKPGKRSKVPPAARLTRTGPSALPGTQKYPL
jgi:hypothetical protein